MNKLNELTPGKNISALVRVIEKPQMSEFGGKKIIKAKVGDGTNIANLVAWDKETKRWNLDKGDIVNIVNGVCPETHKTAHQPPTITMSSKTILEKKNTEFLSIEDCTRRKFLDEISEYQYSIVNGFISQVYRTASYFCKRCKKFSDEMCDCGNFPEPIFRISGVFSDGTKSLGFTTVSEEVAEDLTGVKRSNAKGVDPKCIMDNVHTLLVYLREERLYVEEVLG